MKTVIAYFIFDFFDRKSIKDEREDLVKLKTYELVHRCTIYTLLIIAAILLLRPGIPAEYFVLAVASATIYAEIFGKLYYRKYL